MATQLASARSAGGNAFGHDNSVWDRFAAAEDKIDQASTQAEVDASLGNDDLSTADFDAKLLAASREAGNSPALLEGGGANATGSPIDDELAALKAKAEAKKKTP